MLGRYVYKKNEKGFWNVYSIALSWPSILIWRESGIYYRIDIRLIKFQFWARIKQYYFWTYRGKYLADGTPIKTARGEE